MPDMRRKKQRASNIDARNEESRIGYSLTQHHLNDVVDFIKKDEHYKTIGSGYGISGSPAVSYCVCMNTEYGKYGILMGDKGGKAEIENVFEIKTDEESGSGYIDISKYNFPRNTIIVDAEALFGRMGINSSGTGMNSGNSTATVVNFGQTRETGNLDMATTITQMFCREEENGYLGSISPYEMTLLMKNSPQLFSVIRENENSFMDTVNGKQLVQDYISELTASYVAERNALDADKDTGEYRGNTSSNVSEKLEYDRDFEFGKTMDRVAFISKRDMLNAQFNEQYHKYQALVIDRNIDTGRYISDIENETARQSLEYHQRCAQYFDLSKDWEKGLSLNMSEDEIKERFPAIMKSIDEKDADGNPTQDAKYANDFLEMLKNDRAYLSVQNKPTEQGYQALNNAIDNRLGMISRISAVRKDGKIPEEANEQVKYYSEQVRYLTAIAQRHPENPMNRTYVSGSEVRLSETVSASINFRADIENMGSGLSVKINAVNEANGEETYWVKGSEDLKTGLETIVKNIEARGDYYVIHKDEFQSDFAKVNSSIETILNGSGKDGEAVQYPDEFRGYVNELRESVEKIERKHELALHANDYTISNTTRKEINKLVDISNLSNAALGMSEADKKEFLGILHSNMEGLQVGKNGEVFHRDAELDKKVRTMFSKELSTGDGVVSADVMRFVKSKDFETLMLRSGDVSDVNVRTMFMPGSTRDAFFERLQSPEEAKKIVVEIENSLKSSGKNIGTDNFLREELRIVKDHISENELRIDKDTHISRDYKMDAFRPDAHISEDFKKELQYVVEKNGSAGLKDDIHYLRLDAVVKRIQDEEIKGMGSGNQDNSTGRDLDKELSEGSVRLIVQMDEKSYTGVLAQYLDKTRDVPNGIQSMLREGVKEGEVSDVDKINGNIKDIAGKIQGLCADDRVFRMYGVEDGEVVKKPLNLENPEHVRMLINSFEGERTVPIIKGHIDEAKDLLADLKAEANKQDTIYKIAIIKNNLEDLSSAEGISYRRMTEMAEDARVKLLNLESRCIVQGIGEPETHIDNMTTLKNLKFTEDMSIQDFRKGLGQIYYSGSNEESMKNESLYNAELNGEVLQKGRAYENKRMAVENELTGEDRASGIIGKLSNDYRALYSGGKEAEDTSKAMDVMVACKIGDTMSSKASLSAVILDTANQIDTNVDTHSRLSHISALTDRLHQLDTDIYNLNYPKNEMSLASKNEIVIGLAGVEDEKEHFWNKKSVRADKDVYAMMKGDIERTNELIDIKSAEREKIISEISEMTGLDKAQIVEEATDSKISRTLSKEEIETKVYSMSDYEILRDCLQRDISVSDTPELHHAKTLTDIMCGLKEVESIMGNRDSFALNDMANDFNIRGKDYEYVNDAYSDMLQGGHKMVIDIPAENDKSRTVESMEKDPGVAASDFVKRVFDDCTEHIGNAEEEPAATQKFCEFFGIQDDGSRGLNTVIAENFDVIYDKMATIEADVSASFGDGGFKSMYDVVEMKIKDLHDKEEYKEIIDNKMSEIREECQQLDANGNQSKSSAVMLERIEQLDQSFGPDEEKVAENETEKEREIVRNSPDMEMI